MVGIDLGSDSDVSVVEGAAAIYCRRCPLEHLTVACPTRTEMIDHLEAHRELGHRVPAEALLRLQAERWVYGDQVSVL